MEVCKTRCVTQSLLGLYEPSPSCLFSCLSLWFDGHREQGQETAFQGSSFANSDISLIPRQVVVDNDSVLSLQYIHPADSVKLGQAELVVIDEAAAIPLPLVKNLLGPYLVFMASTING